MPESYIFHGSNGVATQDPRQTTNTFTQFRIAFVGHRRGALLTGGKWLEGFADFGTLEMANLLGHLFQRTANQRQGSQKMRMAVALYDLAGDRGNTQAHLLTNILFYLRRNSSMGADWTGDFADGHL